MTLRERIMGRRRRTAAAPLVYEQTYVYFMWGTIPYGMRGINIFTAASTISCVSFYFIIFGYDLLATWRSFRACRV